MRVTISDNLFFLVLIVGALECEGGVEFGDEVLLSRGLVDILADFGYDFIISLNIFDESLELLLYCLAIDVGVLFLPLVLRVLIILIRVDIEIKNVGSSSVHDLNISHSIIGSIFEHFEQGWTKVIQYIDTDAFTQSTSPPANNHQRREIGVDAVWTLSSAKTGNGVEQLRDDNTNTFWQSDGSQPHLINIQFMKKTRIQEISIYLDFKSD